MTKKIKFEEKAKKWADKMYPCDGQAQRYLFMGAKFGYNEKCSELVKELEEANKANEWHYMKDGKYPKEKQLVMVYRVNPLGANIAITNWYDSYKDTKVIAWKEIVLPELPKVFEESDEQTAMNNA